MYIYIYIEIYIHIYIYIYTYSCPRSLGELAVPRRPPLHIASVGFYFTITTITITVTITVTITITTTFAHRLGESRFLCLCLFVLFTCVDCSLFVYFIP